MTPAEQASRVLVIGFGNPGRLDDGLGPALAAELEELGLLNVTVDSNYQLTVEDSDAVKDHDVVIFVDASVDCKEPFEFYPIAPEAKTHFSSHFLAPEDVLGLAQDAFSASTRGYVLAIRGYEFNEFGERLSVQAATNLKEATQFLLKRIQQRDFDS